MAKPDDAKTNNSAGQASDSPSKKDKKRKRDHLQPSSKKTASATTEATPKILDKRDRESWKKKKEKAKAHRNKKRRAERAIEHVAGTHNQPSSSSVVGSETDMAIEPIFTTSTGHIVHTQNAGHILMEYLHAFNQDPSTFIAEYDYDLIPPADLAERKWKRDPKNPHQPPPGALYSCTVTMPPGVSVRSAAAAPPGLRSKMLAKQNAMGMMVKALMDAGEISQELEPKPSGPAVKGKIAKAKDLRDMKWFDKQGSLDGATVLSPNESIPGTTLTNRWIAFKEGMRDQLPAQPITKDGKKGHVDVTPIASPDFWQSCPPFGRGVSVYPTLIILDTPDHQADCRTICLLTTLPVPELQEGLETDLSVADIPGRKAIKASARLIGRPKISKLDDDQLRQALVFTRRTIREHLVHPYETELSKCSWLLLPMEKGYDANHHAKVKRKHFDWDQVRTSTIGHRAPFDMENLLKLAPSELSDMMYTVNSEFAQRHCIVKVRTGLKPSSPHPKHPECTIASHAVRGIAEGPQPQLKYPNQPVLQCTIANPGRHGGYPVELAETEESSLVIPELGVQTGMSASVYRTTSILPTLLPRLDNFLIARQMSDKIFKSTIRTPLALQAISAPMSVHSPLESYERLEILGDTLLKLMATVDLYIRPRDVNHNEDKVQQARHMVLSNRSLQTVATAAGINPYIRYTKHKPKDWIPIGWTREGVSDEEVPSRQLGAKVVSDVAEALIAASYLSGNRDINSAVAAAQTLNVGLKALSSWSDAVKFASKQPITSTDTGLGSLLGLSSTTICGYKFRDNSRATCVLSRSKTQEQSLAGMKYRLLGDSLFEYFIIEELWDQYPEAGPQEITVMKHSRMNAPALSAMCALSPIFAQLQDIPQVSESDYKKYRKAVVATQKEADKEILEAAAIVPDDASSDGEEVGKEWWADMSQSHLVGDVAESVLGAVFEDSCYDLEASRKIYRDHFAPFLGRYCLGPHRHSQHPKSRLDQLLMGKLGCRNYEFRKDGAIKGSQEVGASVVVHGQVMGTATAPWNELAIRRACVKVLGQVKAEPDYVSRLCDCRKPTKEP